MLQALSELPGLSELDTDTDTDTVAVEPAETGVARRDRALLHALEAALARGREGDGDVLALAEAYPPLLQWVPADPPGGSALVRAGSGERRSRGAFATPPALAAELAATACGPILDGGRVPTVVDPACGAGALLRAALAVLLEAGVPAVVAATCLHGVDLDPVAVALARAALAVELCRAGLDPDAARDAVGRRILVGDALLGPGTGEPDDPDEPTRLRWDVAFGEILARPDRAPEDVTGWRGGFDAVVANPPWERWKVHARDWSGLPPAQLRQARAADAAHVRSAGRHPLTGRGEVNAYLPFLETCWRLLAPDGRGSVVVPAGVATDRSASPLVLALVATGSLERLRVLGEGLAAFDDVSPRVGVAVLDLRRGAPRRGERIDPDAVPPATVVPAGSAGSAGDPASSGTWALTASLMRLVAPNVPTVPLCSTVAEHDLLVRTHRRRPVLLRRDRDPAGEGPWGLRLVTPLHMSRDARWFRTVPGPGLVPLWEAKQAGLLDHRGGSVVQPRYWVPAELMAQRLPDLWGRGWLAGYRNVTVAEGARTLLPCALPLVGVGNSLPLIDAPELPLLLALLASVPADFLVRSKHAGANLNFFKLEQVALPPPERFDVTAPSGLSLRGHVLALLRDAVVWHDDGPAALAAELAAILDGVSGAGSDGAGVPPTGPVVGPVVGPVLGPVLGPVVGPVVRVGDRAEARAGLDAAAAWALGWSREDLATAFSGFARLRDQQVAAHGAFVAQDAALGAYEALVGVFGEPG